MSNIIPPLLSNSPPPPPSPDDEDDDEFGDFTGVNDLSYGCDNLSLPPSPDHSPKKVSVPNGLDINSNSEKNKIVQVDLGIDKDFQDKRKSSENLNELCDLKKKYVGNVEENVLQYSEKSVPDTPYVPDVVPEDTSGVDLKNHCSVNPSYDPPEQQLDVETENKSKDDEKFENTFSTHLKETEFNIKLDNLEEASDVTNDLENTLNLEKQVDLGEDTSVEADICELKNEVNSCEEFTVTQEFDNITQQDNSQVMETEERDNAETSSKNSTNWNTFENNQNLQREQSCSDDEFADFAFANTESKNVAETTHSFNSKQYEFVDAPVDSNSEELICKQSLQNECSSTKTILSNAAEKTIDNPIEDDFDDFCEFTSNTVAGSNEDGQQFSSKIDDDFGNFANFSEAEEEPVFLLLDEKQAMEKANSILKEMFPPLNIVEKDYQYADVESNDFIFNELKDITETNALTYLWSKSASQNMLLKALNIDARNILYGTSWNPSMPRFAANLGLTPLEPVKTEMPPCTLKSSPSSSSQPSSSDIPNAQFDWNGSGLVNPLDYSQTMLLDLEQLVASLDIPTCNASSNSNHSSSPANELNDWDTWLQSVPKEHLEMSQADEKKPLDLRGEPSTILQPHVVAKPAIPQKVPSKNDLEQEIAPEQNVDDFEGFTSYQSPTGSETWQNIVPLRETYISNDTKELPLDITNWLQPTIVTPELPRKDLEIGDEELPNIQTPEFIRKEVAALGENDDEFDDFQMVLPEPPVQKNKTEAAKSNPSNFLHSLQPKILASLELGATSTDYKNLNFPEEKYKIEAVGFANDVSQTKTGLKIDIVKQKEPIVVDDEDDFTEFHCSAPVPQPTIPKPMIPILEPLKPVPLYPTASTAPTQINWPDPGITDDEIKKFEMVFKRPQAAVEEKKAVTEKTEQTNKVSKESSLDDDEWSDFVSVQKPSPVHKFHSSEKERTSSPDLPLSVLNLGNIQPTKQPIPVITPQGLIQTKLSSSNSLNMSPKLQPKNNTINLQQRTMHQKPQFQPSIISNQFASQVFNFNNGNLHQNKAVLNFPSSQPQSASGNLQSQDDDDWSDFISSPLPSTTSNGYQQNWQNTSTYKQSNWTNPSPNIITNPRHFVQSGGDMKNKKVSNMPVNSKKSTIPSISLPELEFIAPKERTSSSRKK